VTPPQKGAGAGPLLDDLASAGKALEELVLQCARVSAKMRAALEQRAADRSQPDRASVERDRVMKRVLERRSKEQGRDRDPDGRGR
tara:strand:+ start:26640 stop:26897 length:258 start_codon:yes stop_codon:yes gene_type:complete